MNQFHFSSKGLLRSKQIFPDSKRLLLHSKGLRQGMLQGFFLFLVLACFFLAILVLADTHDGGSDGSGTLNPSQPTSDGVPLPDDIVQINPGGDTVLTAGQEASLRSASLTGTLTFTDGAKISGPGNEFVLDGMGTADAEGFDLQSAEVLLGRFSVPVKEVQDVSFSDGKMQGVCGEGCSINGIPVTSGTTFVYNPKEDLLSGSCGDAAATTCTIGTWEIGFGVDFEYDRSEETASGSIFSPNEGALEATCTKQPCLIGGIFIPSNGALDNQLRDDPELFRKYQSGEFILEDYDPAVDLERGPIKVTLKRQGAADAWDMYIEPAVAERGQDHTYYLSLEQIRAVGEPVRVIIEGKNAVVFENGDSYTHDLANFDGVTIYPSGNILIGESVEYSQASGIEIFPFSPTLLCYSGTCQKEVGQALVQLDPQRKYLRVESDLHPIDITFEEKNPYLKRYHHQMNPGTLEREVSLADFDADSYFSLTCSEFCSLEAFDRSTPEEIGRVDVPAFGMRQVGGNVKIRTTPGSYIESEGFIESASEQGIYRTMDLTSPGSDGSVFPYELVVANKEGAIVRKGYGTESGVFIIDERQVLADLLVPVKEKYYTPGERLSRPFLEYNTARDFHSFCDNLAAIGGKCATTNIGRTLEDQEELAGIRNKPGGERIAATGAGSPHTHFAAVDMKEGSMRIPLSAEARARIKAADGVFEENDELLRSLPAKGNLGAGKLDSLLAQYGPGSPEVKDFEYWARMLLEERKVWAPIAAQHNLNLDVTTNGCRFGRTSCVNEGWHLTHESVHGALGQEQHVQAYHPLQTPVVEQPLAGSAEEGTLPTAGLNEGEGKVI